MRARHALLVIALWALALAGAPALALVGAGLAWAIGAVSPAARRLPWALLAVFGAVVDVANAAYGGTAGDIALASLVPMVVFAAAPDRASVAVGGLMLLAASTRVDPLGFAVLATIGAMFAARSLSDAVLDEVGGRRVGHVPLWLGPLLALPLFLFVPRGAADEGEVFAGFSTSVTLGQVSAVVDDPAPVLSIELAAAPLGPMYLRGAAFERFDGRAWSTAARSAIVAPPAGTATDVLIVTSEPVDGGVLFTTGTTVGLFPDGAVRLDDAGTWRIEGTPRRSRWTLHAIGPYGPGSEGPGGPPSLAHVELPRLHGDIPALARRWVGTADADQDRVDAIVGGLAAFEYTKSPGGAGVADPLAEFLLVRRTGHCEYFASALAVMLRLEGLPTRLVTGFAGGEWDAEARTLTIRASDAHAWVEVYVDGRWLLVDATPAPVVRVAAEPSAVDRADRLFDDWFVEFDQQAQIGLVTRLARAAVGPLGALVFVASSVAVVVLIARRSRRAVRGPVATEYDAVRVALVRAGWSIPPHLPPVAAAQWLREQVGDEAAPFEELAWLHYRVRYGGISSESVLDSARSLARAAAQIRERRPFEA